MTERDVSIHEFAAAKVNLYLEVLKRRDDGYHELETIMHEIDFGDELKVSRRASGFSLVCDNETLLCDESNLIAQALRATERHCERALPCDIELKKQLPMGGGLGGGSSNAAATIRALNRLYSLDLSYLEMEKIAAEFGSDTAFFVRGGSSLCRGRGEMIEPIDRRKSYSFVVIMPGFGMATPAVFQTLELGADFQPRKLSQFLTAWDEVDFSRLKAALFNRLEQAAVKLHEPLRAILDHKEGGEVMLSGSGSSCFCLCENLAAAQELASFWNQVDGISAIATQSYIRAEEGTA